jgi:hypothetical protein
MTRKNKFIGNYRGDGIIISATIPNGKIINEIQKKIYINIKYIKNNIYIIKGKVKNLDNSMKMKFSNIGSYNPNTKTIETAELTGLGIVQFTIKKNKLYSYSSISNLLKNEMTSSSFILKKYYN